MLYYLLTAIIILFQMNYSMLFLLLGTLWWQCFCAPYDKEDLLRAIEMIEKGEITKAEASRIFRIPESTIRYRLLNRQSPRSTYSSSASVLTRIQEKDLASYVRYLSERGFQVTTRLISEKAHEMVTLTDKEWHTTDKLRWSLRFMQRHNLALRIPNNLNSNSMNINESSINDYFDLLTNLNRLIDFVNHPERVLNMNETGWGKQAQFKKRTVCAKGSKHPFVKKSFSIDHITSVHTISAGGHILHPMLIFKNNIPSSFNHENPYNWTVASSESGFMNQILFLLWLETVILPYVKKLG